MSGHESASVEMDSRDEEAERILERTIQKALVEFEELYGYALYDWVNYRLDALWHKLHEELKDMCGEGLTITQRDFVEELLSRIAKLHANIYKVCNGWIASFFYFAAVDRYNRKRLQLVEAKIHRLVKYYKSTGVLPENFEVQTLYKYE